jgi:hypothetical protein
MEGRKFWFSVSKDKAPPKFWSKTNIEALFTTTFSPPGGVTQISFNT